MATIFPLTESKCQNYPWLLSLLYPLSDLSTNPVYLSLQYRSRLYFIYPTAESFVQVTSCDFWTLATAPYLVCLLSYLIIPAFSKTKTKQTNKQQNNNTDLVILVLKTLQGFSISFIAKFLTITCKDIADLGSYNFSDFISYDRSPCPLCCRHTDL